MSDTRERELARHLLVNDVHRALTSIPVDTTDGMWLRDYADELVDRLLGDAGTRVRLVKLARHQRGASES